MTAANYSLADLIDLDIILGVMDNFYKATNIPPSITDIEGNVLLTVGFKSLCQDFHRKHPETRKKCHESDTTLSRELVEKGAYACYECLNGLVDVALPIVIGGKHMANLFIGQFFMDTPPDREFFRQQAKTYGFDKTAYMAALDEIPIFPRKQVEEAIRFLSSIGNLIGEMALTQKRLTRFNEKLEETVRKRTCQLKKESEDRKRALAEFQAIFNNSSVAIAHIKGDRVVHNVNERFIEFSGYSREELIGKKTALGYTSLDEYEKFGEYAAPILASGEVVQTDFQFQCKDGHILWASLNGKAINPPALEDGVIWVLDDITKRKELEVLKEDVERILRHDLKVPLNGIVGLSQSLLLDDNLTLEQREDIKRIEESGYRMNNQINESMELYKIETGTYEFFPIEVDMGNCIRKIVRDLSHKAAAKRLQFDIRIKGIPMEEAPIFLCQADPMLSHTMLSNLLNNAVEAAPDATTIAIALGEHEDHAVIRMSNQGAVPHEILETFFGKYITHGKESGTGLGTYTAKLMTEAQGGNIAMASSEQDGTSITVRLPKGN